VSVRQKADLTYTVHIAVSRLSGGPVRQALRYDSPACLLHPGGTILRLCRKSSDEYRHGNNALCMRVDHLRFESGDEAAA
jgi:hypothetical protein